MPYSDPTSNEHVFNQTVVAALHDLSDNHPFKSKVNNNKWLLQTELILYQSDRSKNASFSRGIIYGISGDSQVGLYTKQLNQSTADNKSLAEFIFDKYLEEVSQAVQSVHYALEPYPEDMKFLKKSAKIPIGTALVIDKRSFLKRIPSNVVQLFDYIIYNPLTRQSAEGGLFSNGIGWGVKLTTMLHSPFWETIYVDADTRFCSHPFELFDVLSISPIALARDVRTKVKFVRRSLKLDFNAGVVVYQKTDGVAKLMHEIFRILLNNVHHGDQSYWMDTMENAKAFGELRYHVLSPRFHLQPCKGDTGSCFIEGPVVIVHGRCWLTVKDPAGTRKFCRYLNKDLDTRLVRTNCNKLKVYKVESGDGLNSTLNTVPQFIQIQPQNNTQHDIEQKQKQFHVSTRSSHS
eukprot:CAMPEP_0182450356 /NCGR_PEP_ID=MMETSP1172-20130603/40736_1 /TAXON_ID=708627 /ORGANISM="Timspurckia oligopyrenoides, Strain CCMP3278" /LENGTH=404 /DNA_ID=CAMNT_0024647933 /DNA_START=291 /DNA_END=1505 /DNA_ORIENTATION=-